VRRTQRSSLSLRRVPHTVFLARPVLVSLFYILCSRPTLRSTVVAVPSLFSSVYQLACQKRARRHLRHSPRLKALSIRPGIHKSVNAAFLQMQPFAAFHVGALRIQDDVASANRFRGRPVIDLGACRATHLGHAQAGCLILVPVRVISADPASSPLARCAWICMDRLVDTIGA